jgi:hypothetical protein
MFLHREFIPLLPLRVTKPTGPIDPPFFHSEAPLRWWESSAATLHNAAESVTDILAQLGKTNNFLMSPLAGFCVFTATLTHLHVAAFPHINMGNSKNASDRAETGIMYLRAFGRISRMSEDWVSPRLFGI